MPEDSEPTEAAVLAVLDAYFGKEAVRAAARRRLAEWGDSALPVLRALASRPSVARKFAMTLAAAIREVGTEASSELLVEILAGRLALHRSHALQVLRPTLSLGIEPRCATLLAQPGLEEAVLGFLGATNWNDVCAVAEIAAARGWTSAVPQLRELLRHEHVDVRKAAARALGSLTGEPVPLDLPALELP
ncbi:MAG TPA: HEAT repeat domain-containing protein, partial [Planctomycetota bacterium]|nr:HEAT repeat domain-containing protein [Planctomycetota bacterium]